MDSLSELNFALCIICQTNNNSKLVKKPTGHDMVMKCMILRIDFNDPDYVHMKQLYSIITTLDMKNNSGSWHSECYSKVTHKKSLERLQKSHALTPSTSCSQSVLRSNVPKLNDFCFFCNKKDTKKYSLYTIVTDEAGMRLRNAVQMGDNEEIKVELSGFISEVDARAYEVKYHRPCWTTNVVNVLRKSSNIPESHLENSVAASEVEFLSKLRSILYTGTIINMQEVEELYLKICNSHDLPYSYRRKRKYLKASLMDEFQDDVYFSDSKNPSKPQNVCLQSVKDHTFRTFMEKKSNTMDEDLKILYEASVILRRDAAKTDLWKFNGSLVTPESKTVIPVNMLQFFKWGINDDENYQLASFNDSALRVSQVLLFEILSNRQVKHKSNIKRRSKDYPLQTAVGIIAFHSTRSQFLVKFLNKLGCSINYDKMLRIETQIALSVLKNMSENGNIYIPPDLVENRFIFCAADNIDFLEDTIDGKNTLHGTVMVVYQAAHSTDEQKPLKLVEITNERSLKSIPPELSNILPCNIPKKIKPLSPLLNSGPEKRLIIPNKDIIWILMKHFEIKTNAEATPSWPAYNALVSKNKSQQQTRVCLLPLINETPTSTSTQFTLMKKLETLNSKINGPDKKIVVTLDMGLYKPVKRMSMVKTEDVKMWVTEPGELHILMAELHAIGIFIDGNGIPELWRDLYGDSVINKILNGKHVRRGIRAHTPTLAALYSLYMQQFLCKYPKLSLPLTECFSFIHKPITEENIKNIHEQILVTLKDLRFVDKMEEFNKYLEVTNVTFKMLRQYMDMVETLLLQIKAIRLDDWEFHLSNLDLFTKYFFSMDLINYSGMIAWFLAEIQKLRDTSIWEEFCNGNWVVNKSNKVFTCLGSDEALEHINRALKVTGGLVGMTQKPDTMAKFFLTIYELDRLSNEGLDMIGSNKTSSVTKHHELNKTKSEKASKTIRTIIEALKSSINPFTYEGGNLVNIHTGSIFSTGIENDVCNMSVIGLKEYESLKKIEFTARS